MSTRIFLEVKPAGEKGDDLTIFIVPKVETIQEP
jgi:hypothetical protein